MTVALASAATLIAIPLLDHVVVGRDGYRSLFEMGVLNGC
jgi:DNA repair protein RadC